jgi:hypothetical protein
MPRQRKPRKGKRQAAAGQVPRNMSRTLQDFVTRVPFRNIPFYIEQASSGTGVLTSANSLGSFTASNTAPINPFNLGARVATLAADFVMYRFESIRIKYVPFVTESGVVSTPAPATTNPSYAERAFAMGVVQDTPFVSLSFQSLVEFGADVFTTCRPATVCSLTAGPLTRWMFTSATASSPSNVDLRWTAPLRLLGYFADTSTTSAARYGCLIVEGILQFRGPVNNVAPVGLSTDEEKMTSVSVGPLTQTKTIPPATANSSPASGWFGSR